MTTLANTHRTVLRRKRTIHELPVDVVPDVPVLPDTDGFSETLLQALLGLPQRQRAVVVLRFYEDLSVEQTADVLRCSTGTVKSQTHDALNKLVATGHQRVRRGRTRALAAVAAVAVVAGGTWAGLSLSEREDSTPVIDRSPLKWSDRDVPWVDAEGVHFGTATMPRPDDLVRVVATLDAAFVQTPSGLTQLDRDGAVTERGPIVGDVQADPFGPYAAWATADQLKVVDTRVGSGLDVDRGGWEVTSIRGATATVVESGTSYALSLEGGGREPIHRADGLRVIGLTDDWILGSQGLVSRHGFLGDNTVSVPDSSVFGQ